MTDPLTIERLHPHIGAQIRGADLTRPLDDAVFGRIRDAFNEHSVLVFRDQRIDDAQQIAFSRRFGPLEKISFPSAATNPYVYQISNIDNRGRVLPADAKKRVFLAVNMRWHTNSSFKPVPALASVLSGREIRRAHRTTIAGEGPVCAWAG